MVIDDGLIRAVGKFEGKGRYYSSSQNFYYIGTEPDTNMAYFVLDVKPVCGDYLVDQATNIGYFVCMVSPVLERDRYFQVVLLQVNNSISIIRLNPDKRSAGTYEKSVMAARIPCLFRIESAKLHEESQRLLTRYNVIMQTRYRPQIADTLVTQNERILTVLHIDETEFEGLISIKALN